MSAERRTTGGSEHNPYRGLANHARIMTLETQDKPNIFSFLVDEAKAHKGEEIEIVTFANDTVSGYKKYYSRLGILGEQVLNSSLTDFIKTLVPEGESRETLEAGFKEEFDSKKEGSHHDEVISEWVSVIDNILIGIKAIRDQRSESVRTWYLKSF